LPRRQENLCDRPLFTGYTRDGGFATATIADARFAFPLGEEGTTWRSRRCCAPA
jgi:propanol-preferring alcohol dehydrogenase